MREVAVLNLPMRFFSCVVWRSHGIQYNGIKIIVNMFRALS